MKAALYLRVSSDDQHRENQLPALIAECAAKGYEVGQVYEESESAYRSGRQHELARLFADCQNGARPAAVMVWSVDRLSRQGISHLLSIVRRFKTMGVKVYSHCEPWLSTGDEDMGELTLAVLGFCAKYESRIKSERTRAGQARARGEGKHIGRPKGRKDGHKRQRAGYFNRYAHV